MIVSAEFKNFRALRDVKIDLEPFTVIVGPNSCGKSTLLEGLNILARGPIMRHGLLYQNMSRRATGDVSISGNVFYGKEVLFSEITRYGQTFDESIPMISTSEGYSEEQIRKVSRNTISLYPDRKAMSSASYGSVSRPVLESDGRGLATICANLQLEYPKIFQEIQKNFSKVIAPVEGFRIKRAQTTNYLGGKERVGTEVIGEELVFDFTNAPNIPASLVSEGTLITLCILVATARADNKPFMILLDDLERGLHPKATRDLVNVLRDLQKKNPNLQIIATTHSPYLLDHFEPKEVRVAALDPVRGTVIARLDESPDFEKWHEVLNTGELWSHVGEKWVLERDVSKDDTKESV